MKPDKFKAEIQLLDNAKLVEQHQLYSHLVDKGVWDHMALEIITEEMKQRGLL